MKKFLAITVLFLAFAAQGQSITEKDLLGEWRIVKMEVEGVLVNFDTGEVKVVDPDVGNDNLEMIQSMVESGSADEIKEAKLFFKPGAMVDVHDGSSVQTVSYTLEDKVTSQVLTLNTPDPSGLEALLEDGFLKLVDAPEGENRSVMYMVKK
ncbi:MAG: hypothetical protein V4581_14985 [Bacteroidota bacterium]